VTKFLTATALALALAGIPLAASARTNVTIGVQVGAPVYGAPYYRGYDEGSIRAMLYSQGYRVDYIDRRGGVFFVRVFYGPTLYQGTIGCNDGRWIRRERVSYRRYDRDYGRRDRDWNRGRDWR
jgi:hypothetical protein